MDRSSKWPEDPILKNVDQPLLAVRKGCMIATLKKFHAPLKNISCAVESGFFNLDSLLPIIFPHRTKKLSSDPFTLAQGTAG